MDTAKLSLAAQRYEEAEGALEAAAEDLKAESASALAQGAEEREIVEAVGRTPDELRDL
ncbi:hypothetical protein [Streptomyces sp. NBC_01190]|uniref:hypothetical protein n=1 Tax=Streptomyces sp. NBC_01190 TaxID=2903767 RepID=UPI0038651FBD|nr:hypothetical protein OG519_00530 [Streptomyces sp. NBC_01190]